MTHNHSPKSVVGRHGLTLKFNKVCVFAYKCTVPRGKLKKFVQIFKYPNEAAGFTPEHMHAGFYLHAEGYLCRSMLVEKRLVRALVSNNARW